MQINLQCLMLKQNTPFHSGFVCDGIPCISISRLLKSDSKNKTSKKASALAKSKGISAHSRFQAERGVAVHQAARDFLKDGEIDLPAKYYPYWENIWKSLSLLDIDPFWIEGPVIDSLSHLQQGIYSAVWNKRYQYAGSPDLVANIGGVNCVVEFKTSDLLWQDRYVFKDFKHYTNWHKYSQAAMQTAAYAKAFTQTTGIAVDTAIIINATRDDSQMFIIERPELKKHLTKFHTLAKEFLT